MTKRIALLVSICSIALSSTFSLAQEKILVVGAGFAGLAAAKELHESGYDVTVLEARNRIGGRIYTDRSTGIALDMGASWIHGLRNNPIKDLADQLGAPLSSKTNYDNLKEYDFDGTPTPLTSSQDSAFVSWLTKQSRRAYNKKANYSYETIIESAWNNGDFDFLDNRRQLDYLVNVYIEHEFSGDVSNMSAQQWWEGEDLRGGDKVFPNGYDQLTNYLANNLDIRLNTVVTHISHDSNGVSINTNQGIFTGDRTVITLPVGVLEAGDVTFSPTLPNAKLKAIDRLEMGTLNKVWMVFPHTFWDIDKDLIGYLSVDKGHFSEWYYFDELASNNVLIAFNAGDYAEAIESKSDQEIINEAMDTLRVIYGNNIPQPENYVISRWHSDPYSKGSYAYMGAGAQRQDRTNLRSPVNNRLFFAGEATSSAYPATTQGAYETGIEAAKEIIDL